MPKYRVKLTHNLVNESTFVVEAPSRTALISNANEEEIWEHADHVAGWQEASESFDMKIEEVTEDEDPAQLILTW